MSSQKKTLDSSVLNCYNTKELEKSSRIYIDLSNGTREFQRVPFYCLKEGKSIGREKQALCW